MGSIGTIKAYRGLGFKDILPPWKRKVNKNMENDPETGIIYWLIRI